MTFGAGPHCKAVGKRTGERCKNPALSGGDLCYLHAGRPEKRRGAPKGNKHNLRHGAHGETVREYKRRIASGADLNHGFLAFEILDEEEQKTFREIIGGMYEEFEPDAAPDFYAVELVAMNMLLFRRAMKAGKVRAAESIDRMIRLHLRDLKAPKAARGKDKKPAPGTTPAEWATSFLKQVDQMEEEERRRGRPAAEAEDEREQAPAGAAREGEE